MSFREMLSRMPILRQCAIYAFRLWQTDISMTNPWTGHKLSLNSYHHKGYWYFGKGREQESMLMFEKLIKTGDTVIEVGGHIGFITQYFSKLVGQQGRVVVFEPGSNNIRYTVQNLRRLQNTTLERIAVSSENGTAILYEDNLTGQNNSLLRDYKNADWVAKSHGQTLVRTPHEVEVVSIDSYVDRHRLKPDFLKIDVEGCEYDVLLGATDTLRSVRALMVEVTMQHDAVAKLLCGAGFKMLDESKGQLRSIVADGNVFGLRTTQFNELMSGSPLADIPEGTDVNADIGDSEHHLSTN
jgi:FkbM family methyltransferase